MHILSFFMRRKLFSEHAEPLQYLPKIQHKLLIKGDGACQKNIKGFQIS